MRFNEFNINEAPLPPEWDKQVYSPKTSYKKRIEYAVARAQKMGKGSSRTAFVIDYQGRPTILKVAHNHKGSIQNSEEANILDDGYVKQMGIAIPLIDYDTEHPEPTWIHTEMAQKISLGQLSKMLKVQTINDLLNYVRYVSSPGPRQAEYQKNLDQRIRAYNKDDEDAMETFYEYVGYIQDLHQSYDMNLNDFNRAANWGLYNGHPVIIDLGFTDESAKLY